MVTSNKRKRVTRPGKRALTLRVDQETFDALQRATQAEAFDVSTAAWVRAAIREKLARDTQGNGRAA